MSELIDGTFHFHSTYSHDGRTSLREVVERLHARGLGFCVMTEHFEDFDRAKFERYVQEIEMLNAQSGFVLVPGVEVNLAGIDTIIFPVSDFDEIVEFSRTGRRPAAPVMTVVAHPSKYDFGKVMAHARTYGVDAIELWNQQADGRHIPPLPFLRTLMEHSQRGGYRFLFGCDLHDPRLTVGNVISIRPSGRANDLAYVVDELLAGRISTRNLATGIAYSNETDAQNADAWFGRVVNRSYYKGAALRSVRRCLKRAYKLLPRDTQRSVNDFKNFVRNKV